MASYPAAEQIADPPPPRVVIGPQYCVGYPINLRLVRKWMTWSEKYGVKDVNGNLMFKVKGKPFSLRGRCTLLDAAGNTIVTFHRKISSNHGRFQVFRGESTDSEDLLFSVKKSSFLQMKMNLHVFLASNTAEQECDFKIKGKYFGKSCNIYAGDSDDIIAQMNNAFGVTVCPNVDYALVVLLVVLLQEIMDLHQAGGSSGGD